MVNLGATLTKASDKLTQAAETALWRTLGWPSEEAWIAAGRPQTRYIPAATLDLPQGNTSQLTRQVESETQTALEQMLVQEQQQFSPLTTPAAPDPVLPIDYTEGALRIEGTPRERLLQQRQGQAVNPLAAPVEAAVNYELPGLNLSAAEAYEGVGSALDAAHRANTAVPGVGIQRGAQAANQVIIPREPWELALEATPLGFAGDIADARRVADEVIPELTQGAATSLVRGTPTDVGTEAAQVLTGPGFGRPVPPQTSTRTVADATEEYSQEVLRLAGIEPESVDEAATGLREVTPDPAGSGLNYATMGQPQLEALIRNEVASLNAVERSLVDLPGYRPDPAQLMRDEMILSNAMQELRRSFPSSPLLRPSAVRRPMGGAAGSMGDDILRQIDEAAADVAPPVGAVSGGAATPTASTVPTSSFDPWAETAPASTATMEPPGGVPPTSPAAGADLPPTGGPLDRLTQAVETARKLPPLTEAERSAERSRRVAAGASILERGGFTPDAFRQARAQQAGEMPRAAFEAPNVSFTPDEVQGFRNQIAESDLRFYERINTEGALTKLLEGRLNEITPSELNLIDRVYGRQLANAIEHKTEGAIARIMNNLHFYWLNSILSGPITQARNIMGNTSTALYSPVNRLVAGGVESVAARATGREQERFWQEAPAAVAGLVEGIPEGVRGALRVIKNGYDPESLGRLDTRPRQFTGPIGRVIAAPTTMLGAMDSLFSSINYRSALNANTVRQARREGHRGQDLIDRIAELRANPSEELVDKAIDESEDLLMRGEPGALAQWFLEGRRKVPGLRYLVPFVTTPANLLKYGIKSSPLGLMDMPMWRRVIDGNPAASDELARTLMGSSITAAIATLAATDQIELTAGVPTNAAARDRFFREGKLPFSIKVPGVGWVEYSSIPGMDVSLTLVASAMQTIDEGGDPVDLVSQAGANIAQSLLNKSYLSGLSDFFDAVNDPVRFAASYATRQGQGFVPFSGAQRQVAQSTDRTVRQPGNLVESLKSGIPGLSQSVPARLTAFGEEADRPQPSPLRVNQDRQTAVDQELEALDTEIGFTGESIAGVKLSRSQASAYQRTAGQLTYQLLDALIQSESYQRLSMGDKIKIIERARDSARDMVRDPINRLVDSEGWGQLSPAQQKQVIDAALARDPQEMLGLMGR